MFKLKLHWQVFIAMALGILFALILGEKSTVVTPLGTIFMRLLKMIIVPLIIFSITSGVASLGDSKTLGRMGAKTFGYYFLTSILAIITGLLLTNIIRPGVGVEFSGMGGDFDPASLNKPDSLAGILIRMIPLNPIKAMADGDMLGIIFWSILFGFSITRLSGKPQEFFINFFAYGFKAMMKLTQGIIALLPIGVFGLITTAVANSGIDVFKAVGKYIITISIGLSIHFLVILPLVFFIFTKINPLKHWKAMASAFATAFSTSSSGATLPVTIDCIENNVGVSNRTTSFVLPLGATINMDGTALYECAGVLFISQALGIDLSISQQVVVVMTAFLASVGAAAVPSAGLVMIFIVLGAVGLGDHPGAGVIVGTMLAVDRPLDMYRTMVNVASDSIGAVVVAKSEGESNLYPNN
ncbi:MAG: dicarboxylate/amino acid:cation symporter [Candidatus Marinimicrobia bacterium]|jgi:Na+/H+-dicarboxylate symporter|nr:dicarboxylate/amino acid:cation symporter [Candidatus Neomarinimicrobiota bacterium]|tara:strand:- start:45 stop:1280 length:1236 start_codon:yes stop_codon:yes gene_type:complete